MSPSFRDHYAFKDIIWSTIMADACLVDVPGIAPEPVFDLAVQARPAAATARILLARDSFSVHIAGSHRHV